MIKLCELCDKQVHIDKASNYPKLTICYICIKDGDKYRYKYHLHHNGNYTEIKYCPMCGKALDSIRIKENSHKLNNNDEEDNDKYISDNVNHPSHYNDGEIEVIDYIEDKGFGKGFELGSAIKYISRAGKKPDGSMDILEKEIEDYEKAIWHVKRYINYLKKNN